MSEPRLIMRETIDDELLEFLEIRTDDPADWDALLDEVRNVLTINHPDDVAGLQELANTLKPRSEK